MVHLPPEDQRHVQHKWDKLLYEQQHSLLLNSTLNDQSKARLLSVASAEAGAWLNVLPVPSLGTKLDDESLRIALGLRLGAAIVVEHTCVCGATVDAYGTHGLSFQRSGGRLPRHASVNETIRRAFVSGGVPAVLEPVRVCCDVPRRTNCRTHITNYYVVLCIVKCVHVCTRDQVNYCVDRGLELLSESSPVLPIRGGTSVYLLQFS